MSCDRIMHEWNSRYCQLTEAAACRDSQAVSFALLEMYDELAPDERLSIHQILSEWLRSPEPVKRYDAAFIISQRRLRELAVIVEEVMIQRKLDRGPEAIDEASKLSRIYDELQS